jgi:hypothetical protein
MFLYETTVASCLVAGGRAYGVRSKAQALQVLKAELLLKICCFLDFVSGVFENVFVSLLGVCHDRADMQSHKQGRTRQIWGANLLLV